MDETEEYMQMNNAYKKRIVQTLRNGPSNENMTAGDVTQTNDTSSVKPAGPEGIMIDKQPDRYTTSLRGRISDAMSKVLGPKVPDLRNPVDR